MCLPPPNHGNMKPTQSGSRGLILSKQLSVESCQGQLPMGRGHHVLHAEWSAHLLAATTFS